MSASPAATLRLGQLFRLARHDLWHERWLAFCAACVLAATLAPLWLLWGLEQGVIGTLIERQDRDPVMREIAPEASGGSRFDAAWFERVRAWPEVAFVMPETRAIASQVDLFSDGASAPLRLDLRPTAANDPWLGRDAVPTGLTLLLSTPAARRLQVAAGQRLQLALERNRDGRDEQAVLSLKVVGVLPLAVMEQPAALASLALLESVQSWRDGYAIEGFGAGGSGPPPPLLAYPLFRMIARSIQDVQTLADRLEKEGTSVRTRAREIEATLGLQRNLRTVLSLIGVIAVSGAVVALSALQIANLRRKRREYALLKLTGHGRSWLIALPCASALAIAVLGAALALVAYAACAAAINAYFAGHLGAGEAAVRLRLADVAAGLCGAVVVSVLPALVGGWRASTLEAADELREN